MVRTFVSLGEYVKCDKKKKKGKRIIRTEKVPRCPSEALVDCKMKIQAWRENTKPHVNEIKQKERRRVFRFD